MSGAPVGGAAAAGTGHTGPATGSRAKAGRGGRDHGTMITSVWARPVGGHGGGGAWWWLLDSGRVAAPAPGGVLVQRIDGQDLPVEVYADGWLAMRQEPPRFGATGRASDVAAVLGLTAGDVLDAPAPQVVDTGVAPLSRTCTST